MDEYAIEIARKLAPDAGVSVDADPVALDHLAWAMAEALETVPGTPEARWYPSEQGAVAYWITSERPGRLFRAEATALGNTEDAQRPFANLTLESRPLIDANWVITYTAQYGPVEHEASGFRTRWEFRVAGELIVQVSGTVGVFNGGGEEWTDDAEDFARALAFRVGYLS